MKFSKLIPLSSVLAISSVVTPLCLTSCARDTFYEFNLADEKNVPEVKALDLSGTLDKTEVTKAYVDAIMQNPQLFINDYVAGQYAFTSQLADEDIKIDEYVLSLTSPVISTTDVYFPGEPDITYPTLSFKVKNHLVGSYKGATGPSQTTNLKFTLDFQTEYKDVPFVIYTEKEVKKANGTNWQVGFMDPADTGYDEGRLAPYIFKFITNPWSIKYNYDFNYDAVTTDQRTERSVTSSNNFHFNTVLDTFTKLNSALLTAWSALGDEPVANTLYGDSLIDEIDALGQYLVIKAIAFDFGSKALGGSEAKADIHAYVDSFQFSVPQENPSTINVAAFIIQNCEEKPKSVNLTDTSIFDMSYELKKTIPAKEGVTKAEFSAELKNTLFKPDVKLGFDNETGKYRLTYASSIMVDLDALYAKFKEVIVTGAEDKALEYFAESIMDMFANGGKQIFVKTMPDKIPLSIELSSDIVTLNASVNNKEFNAFESIKEIISIWIESQSK